MPSSKSWLRRLSLLSLLTAAALPSVAHADITYIGSDLSKPATVAQNDPNDIFWWPSAQNGPMGIDVTVQGEARSIFIKGGTVQTAQQKARAKAFDELYDISHYVVVRPQPDGTWRSVVTSDHIYLPVIGMNGADENTITEYPTDGPRMCVMPGDRIVFGSVGGYVPTVDGMGKPMPGFQDGLPYQIFAPSSGPSTFEFRGGGMIHHETSVITQTPTKPNLELLMKVKIGTGDDARYTCRTEAEKNQDNGGNKEKKPLVPMASPVLKTVKLKKGQVPITLNCRVTGTDCAGTIELRAHKMRIGYGKYSMLKGETKTFAIKLTKKGQYYARAASAGKLRTAVVTTANGGRKASGLFSIKPDKKLKKKR